ncbi:MAG: hypothetical protein OXO49_03940 [Gammaproteobacteria bacterium]|nr:hypothetical protein [Gammaproteobacteria bacterium]MDE0252135.1 hypothetical protein [Gammaproteobacteria bacterium]MDE0402756.1 hypothetical protein [Gammaproteobacteria bacterium]
MDRLHLTGLDGTNPMGFFAALGVLFCLEDQHKDTALWWSKNVVPHAIFSIEWSISLLADSILKTVSNLKNCKSLNPCTPSGEPIPGRDKLKFNSSQIRDYLLSAELCGETLASSLLAEGSFDNNKKGKPSDFYFSAGQQEFLATARTVFVDVTRTDFINAFEGPWRYDSKLPSFGWDIEDDRVYALRSKDPSSEKKHSNPGVEVLALLGLSFYPVYAGRGRTLTQGCSGLWKNGVFSWPLWQKPATLNVVKSLLSHAYISERSLDREEWFLGWGLSHVLSSLIRRTEEGGYGSFCPPDIVWTRFD